MQISPIQQTQNTNFKAKLQLSGNASLLKNEQTQALRTIVDKLGLKTDIVDINLSYKLINNGFINLAIFANNKLSQFLGEFKNNDIYSGVINALEQTKEIFPSVTAIITSSLATENTEDIKKAEDVEKNTVIDSLEKTSKLEPSNNKNQNNNLEMINTKINEFMDYMGNRGYGDIPETFIIMAMRFSIHNDSFLQNEYSKRMQQKKYRFYGDWEKQILKYTGNDLKDIYHNGEYNRSWIKDSTETIYEMLQEDKLKENFTQTIFQILSKDKILENFNIEQLESYYKKLNEKFENFISLNNWDYTGRNYIILEHPITDCIWDSVPSDSYLSEYLKKEAKASSSWYKLEKIQKASAISEALKNKVFRFQILEQLLLNSPAQIPVEKQKEILDTISQSTIREITKEEENKCRNGDAGYYFYNVRRS